MTSQGLDDPEALLQRLYLFGDVGTARGHQLEYLSGDVDLIRRGSHLHDLPSPVGKRDAKVVALTWDQVTITADTVTIDLAGIRINLPPPLDEPVRALSAGTYNSQAAAHPNSPWVFRGYIPGLHIGPTHLRNHLRPVLAILEARLGTLNELTQTTPIAILAETLGIACRR